MSSEPRVQPSPDPALYEPSTMLDFAEPRETYGVDACQALYQSPHWVFAYWEVTDAGLDGARARLAASAEGARLVLRLVSRSGDAQERHDVDLLWHHGRRYLPAPRPGAEIRLAVGLVSREGYFAPIAQSQRVQLPDAEPAPPDATAVVWMTRGADGTLHTIANFRERGLYGVTGLYSHTMHNSQYAGRLANGSGGLSPDGDDEAGR